MSEDNQTGLIRISDDVVSTIAGLAALETAGIAGMSGGISEGLQGLAVKMYNEVFRLKLDKSKQPLI